MLSALALLLLFAQESQAVEAAPIEAAKPVIARNLRYAELEGVDARFHSLDLYAPSEEGSYPVMVMVHGGGWRTGDKANRAMWKDRAPHFVRDGWVYISINYRLTSRAGEPKHPTHVDDVAAALAWIHDHVVEYQGDPDRLFLMGHSAGAHLAALVATDARKLAHHDKSLRILKGVVCLDTAAYDIAKYLGNGLAGKGARDLYAHAFGTEAAAWKDASPQHFLAKKKNIPPMLLFHTKERRAVAHLSQRFVAGLRAVDVPAAAIYAADKDHAGINACIGQEGDPYTALIMRFLAQPRAASSLELTSTEAIHRVPLDGPIRLRLSYGERGQDGVDFASPDSDWEIMVQIDGVPHIFGFTKGSNPQSQLRRNLESLAEYQSVDIQVTEGPERAWLDLDGKIERITWQRTKTAPDDIDLVWEVLPRPEGKQPEER